MPVYTAFLPRWASRQVYDPANLHTVCPTCQCINGCRKLCDTYSQASPPAGTC